MKKTVRIIAIIIALLILIIGAILFFWLGPLVKQTIETIGPKALGSEVRVEKVRIRPFSGTLQIKGLFIGNPAGFKNPSVVELNDFQLILDLRSLRTDTVVITEILIDGPKFTYERKLGSDNIHALQENIAAYTKTTEKPSDPHESDKPSKPTKKVIIKKLTIKNGLVRAKIPGLPTAPIPLPTIVKEDIGEKRDGISLIDATGEIISIVYDSIIKAIAGVGGLAVDVVKGVGGVALDAGMAVGGVALDTGKAVGSVALDTGVAVGGVAVDGVKAVGGVAVDGVKAVGGVAAGTVKGITGLFKKDEEKEKKEKKEK